MSSINSQMIKELREKTGAGMMDCKKALEENNGDSEQAIDWLRKKGLSQAAKKSSRTTAEGLISVKTSDNLGVILELNAETDFVARNDQFSGLIEIVTNELFKTKETNLEKFKENKLSSGNTVSGEIQNSIAVIGENINLRRIGVISVNKGVVVSYIHNAIKDGMGKIGILVALETEIVNDKVKQVAKQIAMHIAATKPESLTTDELDPILIEREKNIFTDQARASGKPESIIEKMVEGRIRKFYEDVVLLEQNFVMDEKITVKQIVSDLSKEINSDVKISSFVRFALGEGIEKEQTDFAAEVASVAKVNN